MDELSEKDHRVALQAALAIENNAEALDALAGLARVLLARDETQAAANLLTFVIQHPDVRYDTYDRAAELYDALEASACPRVIEDAKAFVLGKTVNRAALYALEQFED